MSLRLLLPYEYHSRVGAWLIGLQREDCPQLDVLVFFFNTT